MFTTQLETPHFPKLHNGRALGTPHVCPMCELICPLCEEGHHFWKEMEAALASNRSEPSCFSPQAYDRQKKNWTEFNAAANAYLRHVGAGVPPYAYAQLPPELQQRQHCLLCRQTTNWLHFWDYRSGARLLVCGACSEQQACDRAALVWKIERGVMGKNAWIFQRMRQWITEDGCDYTQLEHQLEQWQMGFNPPTEPAWNHCSEARGILVADADAPYRPQ
jgi:hypothetical protein